MLWTEAPFTGLQSGGHLKCPGGRSNLFINMGLEAEFSVKEYSKPAYHSWWLDDCAIGECHCALRRVSSSMEVDEFSFWVVKGHCISVPPLKCSSYNRRQVFAILLFAVPNNKTGHVVDIAGCCCSWVLLLLYFMRHMQPIGYGVAIYILGLKPFVVLLSLQFLIKHSVEVLLLFSSDSPCYLLRIVLSAAYK